MIKFHNVKGSNPIGSIFFYKKKIAWVKVAIQKYDNFKSS